MSHKIIEFNATDGSTLRGFLYTPKQSAGPGHGVSSLFYSRQLIQVDDKGDRDGSRFVRRVHASRLISILPR